MPATATNTAPIAMFPQTPPRPPICQMPRRIDVVSPVNVTPVFPVRGDRIGEHTQRNTKPNPSATAAYSLWIKDEHRNSDPQKWLFR